MTELEIKEMVRARDNYRCTECDMTNEEHQTRYKGKSLDVHRLTPGSAYSLEGCVTLCKKCHGPKPRSPRGSRPYSMVKFPANLLLKAKIIARTKEIPVWRYLDGLIREVIDKDLAGALASFSKQFGPNPER